MKSQSDLKGSAFAATLMARLQKVESRVRSEMASVGGGFCDSGLEESGGEMPSLPFHTDFGFSSNFPNACSEESGMMMLGRS